MSSDIAAPPTTEPALPPDPVAYRLGLPQYFRGFAWGVVLPAVALTMMGLYSISAAKPEYAKKQLFFLAVGLGVFVAVSLPQYRRLARWAYLGLAVCLVLLAITMFMPARNGARRWIFLAGWQLQPSELTKLAFIVAMAEYLRFRENHRTFFGLAAPFALTLLPMGMILIEPDLGTSLLFPPTLFAMLFAAGARRKHLIGIVVMGVLALPLFWTVMRDYQRMRVAVLLRQLPDGVREKVRTTFRLPDDHLLFGAGGMDYRFRTGDGHHLVVSLETLREGEVFGVDDDDPAVRSGLNRLPENHTDFIFAVWGRQTGFVGSLLLLGTFLTLVYFGLGVAMGTPDPFGRLLAIGITTILAVQALVNVGMIVGLMPITGITLPFVSYGGTSLLSSYAALGLLVNVSRRRPFLLSRAAFEFGED
jgi:cell division protein FtsW (lipid II flippase)